MFIEARLLDCVSYGTAGGPTWLTHRIGLKSGIVRRNPQRSRPQYRFHILYKNLQAEDHAEVLAAFNACMGGVHSFRIKDWSDFQADDELFPVLGTGAPQTLQLAKNYSFGGQTVARPIRKPVTGTVEITADGSPIAATIDYTTGEATFTAPLNDVLRWSGEFDVPVMFSDDELQFSAENKNANGLFLTADVSLEEDFAAGIAE